jgi:hypothetical protein
MSIIQRPITFQFNCRLIDSLEYFIILGEGITQVELSINGQLLKRQYYIKTNFAKFYLHEFGHIISGLFYSSFELKILAHLVQRCYYKGYWYNTKTIQKIHSMNLYVPNIIYLRQGINYGIMAMDGIAVYRYTHVTELERIIELEKNYAIN